MVVRADLNGHLKALKDYFLLAKGDFFQVNNVQHLISLLQICDMIFNICYHSSAFLRRAGS